MTDLGDKFHEKEKSFNCIRIKIDEEHAHFQAKMKAEISLKKQDSKDKVFIIKFSNSMVPWMRNVVTEASRPNYELEQAGYDDMTKH